MIRVLDHQRERERGHERRFGGIIIKTEERNVIILGTELTLLPLHTRLRANEYIGNVAKSIQDFHATGYSTSRSLAWNPRHLTTKGMHDASKAWLCQLVALTLSTSY